MTQVRVVANYGGCLCRSKPVKDDLIASYKSWRVGRAIAVLNAIEAVLRLRACAPRESAAVPYTVVRKRLSAKKKAGPEARQTEVLQNAFSRSLPE